MLQELSTSILAPGHSNDVISMAIPSGLTVFLAILDEICQTDGTIVGTKLTVDLMPGISPSQPRAMTYVDSTLYVTAQGMMIQERTGPCPMGH